MRATPERPCVGCNGPTFSIVRRATLELREGLDMSADFTLFVCNTCGRTEWFLLNPGQCPATKLAEQVTVRDDGPYR